MAGGAADCQYWETCVVALDGSALIAQVPRNPVPATRAPQSRAHLRRGRVQVPVQPRLQLQGHGPEHGYDDLRLGQDRAGALLRRQRWLALPRRCALQHYSAQNDAADVFSVGSGSTFAYGVLDQGYHWDLSDEDALELGRRSIFAAGHRDAFSGNTLNLYHVQQDGWKFIENVDLKSACAVRREPADSRSVAVRARLRRASDPILSPLTCAVPGAHLGRGGGACGGRAAGPGRCLTSPMHRHCRFR